MQATLDMMPTEAKPKMDKHNHKGLDDILRLLKIRKKNFKCSLTIFSFSFFFEDLSSKKAMRWVHNRTAKLEGRAIFCQLT